MSKCGPYLHMTKFRFKPMIRTSTSTSTAEQLLFTNLAVPHAAEIYLGVQMYRRCSVPLRSSRPNNSLHRARNTCKSSFHTSRIALAFSGRRKEGGGTILLPSAGVLGARLFSQTRQRVTDSMDNCPANIWSSSFQHSRSTSSSTNMLGKACSPSLSKQHPRFRVIEIWCRVDGRGCLNSATSERLCVWLWIRGIPVVSYKRTSESFRSA